MQKYLLAIVVGVGLVGASFYLVNTKTVAAGTQKSAAVFDSDGKLQLPTGYRGWVFVGAPLTPNALNNGQANFPEYHHVYVERKNVDAYLKTGSFPEGTVFVKELTRVLNPTFPDGSRREPSGRGYFNGELNGIDVTVKDSKRFAKTNGWGFFTFGHHPLPYAKTADEKPVEECAGCHIANVAKTDMTWIQFYPLLRDKPGYQREEVRAGIGQKLDPAYGTAASILSKLEQTHRKFVQQGAGGEYVERFFADAIRRNRNEAE